MKIKKKIRYDCAHSVQSRHTLGIMKTVNSLAGGAPGDALIALNAEQIRSIQPYVVATIPAAKFNVSKM